MLPQTDEQGYLVPAMDRWADVLAECELLDDEAGDPEAWGAWTDAFTWELGPPPDDDQADAYEPTEDELAWLASNPAPPPIAGGSDDLDEEALAIVRGAEPPGPTDADIEEAAQFAAWQDALDELARLADR